MRKKPLLFLIVGARPNFVKAAPILSMIKRTLDLEIKLIHSGQHYDYVMSKSFFDLFQIPEPDYNLEIGSASHGEQTGRMLIEFEKLFLNSIPDLVMVMGDVNSTIAAALAAVKMNIPVAHVEAGLRSFDRAMPEEINRVLTDHISSIHFATEPAAVGNLKSEGISGSNVHLVGNVMIDALISISDKVKNSNILCYLGLEAGVYSVVTLHRPSNVDSLDGLQNCHSILTLAATAGPVVFPMHPRTLKSIERYNLRDSFGRIPGLRIINPLGYADFMHLVEESRFIMTDSGGIQSEASFLKVPCITLRETTEHLITITDGTNVLSGVELRMVERAIEKALLFDKAAYSIPGQLDGRASQRIATVLEGIL